MANDKGLGMHLSRGIKIGAAGLQFTAHANAPTDGEVEEGRVYMDADGNFYLWDGTTKKDLTVRTLDLAYNGGNTIDIDAVGGDLEIDFNAAASVMVLDADTDNVTVADCIKFATTGTLSVITDAIDASDADIVNALNIGGNAIAGTNFAVSAAGVVTAVGLVADSEKVTAHKQISVPIYATANTAVAFGILPIIDNCKITHISVAFRAVPASTSGTVLLECYNYDTSASAADNLLSTATFDLEGLTNSITADMTLTATVADLQPDDADFVYCVITSNNADMTGGTAGSITIKYTID